MTNFSIVLKSSKIVALERLSSQSEEGKSLLLCSLKWRQNKLWIKKVEHPERLEIPALENQNWLSECLKRSPVDQVCLDSKLRETEVKLWANACEKADKQVVLRIPSDVKSPQKQSSVYWQMKRSMDWFVAAIAIVLLSPILLLLALLVKFSSKGSILLRQWRIGERGKLFSMYRFRTVYTNAKTEPEYEKICNLRQLPNPAQESYFTPIGRWLRQTRLDNLAQLFNVLRGEMSLVGLRPWALYDALEFSSEDRKRLNALPGMIEDWQILAKVKAFRSDVVAYKRELEMEYLCSWSLGRDFKILIVTVPKVIFGGAII
jgi:lipopolysaccharide/colanic/teichoic acid biosynthesis glycosyltransferase